MPFELRPPTGARTPSPDSSQTPAPRADGNSFFKDLAKRRAARMRAMDDARQGAQNAYNDTSRGSGAKIPLRRPEEYGFSSELSPDFEARLRAERHRDFSVRRPETYDFRETLSPDFDTRLDALERERYEADLEELDSNLLEDDEPTPPASVRSSDRRAALAELERAIGPLKREIPRPIKPMSREQIAARSLEQQPWTYQEQRAAQQETGRETPRRMTPIDREREAIIAPIRANQAAAQESANNLKSSISRLTEATQTISEAFKSRFGMPIEALENGSGSLLQEAKIGLLNFGASLGKLFGKKAESPQSLLAQYKEQDALLNNALAEQRKWMDDARRLQRQIDEIQNPLRVATERDRVNVNTLLNRVGTPGRRVAMDTEPTATPFSESTWFQEGQDDSPVINQPYQEGFRARRKREDEDRRVEALLAPIEATFSSATKNTLNLLYSTNLEELQKRLPLAERSLRDLRVATHTDKNKEGDRPALKALRSTISNIQAACKNLSRESFSNNLLRDALALANAITQDGIETLDLAASDPDTSRPERQLLETTFSALTAWKEAYKNHFTSLQMGNGTKSEAISIPRSDGTRTMGYVGQVIGDDVRVLWEDEATGRQKQKDIPIAVLGAYQFAQAMLENRESKDIPIAVLGAYQFAQAMLENRESFEM